MAFLFKNFAGIGWKAKVLKLKESDNFDILKLQKIEKKKYPFFLESSSRGNPRNRFSILFYSPKILLEKKNDKINFLDELDKFWIDEKITQKKILIENKKIPFCGGWFVYLGYELAREIETSLKIPKSQFALPTAFLARVKSSIIFDHVDRSS